ncbi:Predicted ferric reductase [Alteromonadaceae bacterium Bs31]|nr:Predicted ferric reductase [Alteromonadaceae bacterium Bs31]
MTVIKYCFWGCLLLLSGAWLLSDTIIPSPFTYFSFRSVFVQYTGVICMGSMSIAMILALRSKRIERLLNGLDKMYRLHKWLGIAVLVTAILHWWWAKGTKWMVGWGWLSKPERKPRGEQIFSPLEQWLRSQRGLAELVGEWAFYAVFILIVLALIKRFPYRLFRKTHNWLSITYLVFVFHTLVLTKFTYWLQPVGIITAVLLLAGTASALVVLSGRIGYGRKVQGHIESLAYYPGLSVIEGKIKVDSNWKGHAPGQFAFVTSSKREGAHPYTIASAWDAEERTLRFITKALGVWTSGLREWLKVGMPVSVEGPYGCFDFTDSHSRQIWIGGGIGITPFIARMKYLAKYPAEQKIDLFHATRDYDQAAIDKLNADAEAAGVNLHLIVTPRDGRLTPEQVRSTVADWQSASVWYCGPVALGKILRKDCLANGIAPKDFHQELFDMR